MRRPEFRKGLFVVLLCALATFACSRRARGPRPLEPLRGNAVWLSDVGAADEPGSEEALAAFRCAAVFLPAREIVVGVDGWKGIDLPAPARPLSRIPVVLVTSLSTDKDRARGMEAGADAYIVKSGFDRTVLLEAVGQLL